MDVHPPDRCSLCAAPELQFIVRGCDYRHHIPPEFEIYQCRRCRAYQLHPSLSYEDLTPYYPENYTPYQQKENSTSWAASVQQARWVDKLCTQVIKRSGKTGTILDVGSATGLFLRGMSSRGWQCYGIEASPAAAEYARSLNGLSITTGRFEDATLPVADFDAITFWDVLEHLSDPLAAVEKACSLLKPGGLLVISMPNPDGWERHLFKQFWAGWDMPRHLHLFPKSTIFQVLDSIGFQPIEASFFTGGYGMLVLSLEFLSSHPGSLVHRFPFILKFARTPLARLLAYPGYALLNFLQVTSSMTTFARKPLTEPD